jgi:hypothetical protein
VEVKHVPEYRDRILAYTANADPIQMQHEAVTVIARYWLAARTKHYGIGLNPVSGRLSRSLRISLTMSW